MCAVKAFPGPHDYQLGTVELLGRGGVGGRGQRMGAGKGQRDGGQGGEQGAGQCIANPPSPSCLVGDGEQDTHTSNQVTVSGTCPLASSPVSLYLSFSVR